MRATILFSVVLGACVVESAPPDPIAPCEDIDAGADAFVLPPPEPTADSDAMPVTL